MIRCIVCGKLAAANDEGLDLCINHHQERHQDGLTPFVSRYSLNETMKSNGYEFCIYTKRWETDPTPLCHNCNTKVCTCGPCADSY